MRSTEVFFALGISQLQVFAGAMDIVLSVRLGRGVCHDNRRAPQFMCRFPLPAVLGNAKGLCHRQYM